MLAYIFRPKLGLRTAIDLKVLVGSDGAAFPNLNLSIDDTASGPFHNIADFVVPVILEPMYPR